ncbi:hypothetical protein YQE_09475, partial [Dendroctonus ponderosae]
MLVQLDGASIHNSPLVGDWLNRYFPLRWIGRNRPFEQWPPRSPDLTPIDFYFWGTIKNKAYKWQKQNRIPASCKIKTNKEMKNENRGEHASQLDRRNGIIVVKWNDNSVVPAASTAYGVEPLTYCSRYSQQEKKRIRVVRPALIGLYNK